MREPAAPNRGAVRAFSDAPISGPHTDRKCAHRLPVARRGAIRRHDADPSRLRRCALGLRVCRTPMCGGCGFCAVRWCEWPPRLGPAGWHRDVTPQRHSVIEKVRPIHSRGTHRRPPLSVVGRTLTSSCTIGAAAQRSRRATVGLGSAVGGARERCGKAIPAGPARCRPGRSPRRRLRVPRRFPLGTSETMAARRRRSTGT